MNIRLSKGIDFLINDDSIRGLVELIRERNVENNINVSDNEIIELIKAMDRTILINILISCIISEEDKENMYYGFLAELNRYQDNN